MLFNKPSLKIAVGMVVLLILIGLLTFIYHRTAAYQQTLTVTVPFDNTFRYVPSLKSNSKLDTIKVTITGNLKHDLRDSTITPAEKVERIIEETLIVPYQNGVLLPTEHIFMPMDENADMRRFPMEGNPTLENLSLKWFHQLAPLMPRIGAQLTSVRLHSGGLKSSTSRYKISDYTM